MADQCMKICPHLLRVSETNIEVAMGYHFILLRVENTRNRAIACIASRESFSSDVRHFCLWESNLVTFITKLKIRYPVTKIPILRSFATEIKVTISNYSLLHIAKIWNQNEWSEMEE